MSTSTTTTTVLGPGARVVGDLHLDHDAILAGEITGQVRTTAHLELASDAIVRGDVHAASLALAGRVAGDVYVKETTQLKLGGTIQGQLDTGHLTVDPGASYEGTLRLHRPAAAASQSQTPAVHSQVMDAAPRLTLNRSQPRRQVDPIAMAKNAAPETGFQSIPGTVNAGLRPRRRPTGSTAG